MTAAVDTSREASLARVRAYADGETPRIHPAPHENERLVGQDVQRLFGQPRDEQGRAMSFQPPSVHVVGRHRDFAGLCRLVVWRPDYDTLRHFGSLREACTWYLRSVHLTEPL